MIEKVGRNDPCPCGSGKKYKACCLKQAQPTKRKFSASVISQQKKPVDLMERTFGNGIAKGRGSYEPPTEEKPAE